MLKQVVGIIISTSASAYMLSLALGEGITDAQKNAIIIAALIPLIGVYIGIRNIARLRKKSVD